MDITAARTAGIAAPWYAHAERATPKISVPTCAALPKMVNSPYLDIADRCKSYGKWWLRRRDSNAKIVAPAETKPSPTEIISDVEAKELSTIVVS